jgi:hypothetical protein
MGVFMELTRSEQNYKNEKDKELAEFLKNVNKLANKNELYIIAGRKKIRDTEYFMRFQKYKYDFSKLSKNAMQILLYCEQEVDFFNIVAKSKTEIAEKLNIKKQNFTKAYSELVDKKYLLNVKSRKYIVMHYDYGWKGSVTERNEVKNREERLRFEYSFEVAEKITKCFFDEKYKKILEKQNEKQNDKLTQINITHNKS